MEIKNNPVGCMDETLSFSDVWSFSEVYDKNGENIVLKVSLSASITSDFQRYLLFSTNEFCKEIPAG